MPSIVVRLSPFAVQYYTSVAAGTSGRWHSLKPIATVYTRHSPAFMPFVSRRHRDAAATAMQHQIAGLQLLDKVQVFENCEIENDKNDTQFNQELYFRI